MADFFGKHLKLIFLRFLRLMSQHRTDRCEHSHTRRCWKKDVWIDVWIESLISFDKTMTFFYQAKQKNILSKPKKFIFNLLSLVDDIVNMN